VAGAEAVLGTPELGRGGATPADTGWDRPQSGQRQSSQRQSSQREPDKSESDQHDENRADTGAGPGLGARLRSAASGPLRPYAAAPLAVASGLLLVLALPPIDLWPLAPVAVAALTVALAGQRARRGYQEQ